MHGKAKSPAEDVLATTSVSFNGSYTTPVGRQHQIPWLGTPEPWLAGLGPPRLQSPRPRRFVEPSLPLMDSRSLITHRPGCCYRRGPPGSRTEPPTWLLGGAPNGHAASRHPFRKGSRRRMQRVPRNCEVPSLSLSPRFKSTPRESLTASRAAPVASERQARCCRRLVSLLHEPAFTQGPTCR